MIKILSLLLLAVQATVQQDCIVDTVEFVDHGFDNTEPILLNPETLEYIYPKKQNGKQKTETLEYIYPKKQNDFYISVPEGTSILVTCGISQFSNATYPGSIDGRTFVANCKKNDDKQFEGINKNRFAMETIRCLGKTLETAKEATDKTCAEGKGTIINVGYPVSSENKTVPLYEVCFDSAAKTVFYSKFIMAEVQNYATKLSIRSYQDSDDERFFNLQNTVEEIYFSAKSTINNLLGLPANSTKYFGGRSAGNGWYATNIKQEKMADDVQFFYLSQADSAGRLFNTVPLWVIVTDSYRSNWDHIKFALHRVVFDNKIDNEMYVGTYGVSTLPHEQTNKDIELYLYQNGNTKAIPVPKLLWYLVYHRKAKTAIVFVAVNNPFVIKDNDKVCEDVSSKYGWDHALFWERDRDDLGHVYSCRYEDFKKVVTFLPDLEVKGVLNSSNSVILSAFVATLSIILFKLL